MVDFDSGWYYNIDLRTSKSEVEGGILVFSIGEEICHGDSYPISYLYFFPNSYGLDSGMKMERVAFSDCPGSVLQCLGGRPDRLLSISKILTSDLSMIPGWHRTGLERIAKLLEREREVEVSNVGSIGRSNIPFLRPDEEEDAEEFPIDFYEYWVSR